MKKNTVLLLILVGFIGGLQAMKPMKPTEQKKINYLYEMEVAENVKGRIETVEKISNEIEDPISNIKNILSDLKDDFPPGEKKDKTVADLAEFLSKNIQLYKKEGKLLLCQVNQERRNTFIAEVELVKSRAFGKKYKLTKVVIKNNIIYFGYEKYKIKDYPPLWHSNEREKRDLLLEALTNDSLICVWKKDE